MSKLEVPYQQCKGWSRSGVGTLRWLLQLKTKAHQQQVVLQRCITWKFSLLEVQLVMRLLSISKVLSSWTTLACCCPPPACLECTSVKCKVVSSWLLAAFGLISAHLRIILS